MSGREIRLLVAWLCICVALFFVRYSIASQPPPEQVEEAAEAAKLMPDEWPPCKWVNERTCVSTEQWERMVEDVKGE